MLTEKPCLAHYAKDKDNMVTTDASKTGLGITLWQKQDDGQLKPIAFGSRYLNDTEKNYSIGELELLAVVWGLEKFRFYLYGKKGTRIHGSSSIRTSNKKQPKQPSIQRKIN